MKLLRELIVRAHRFVALRSSHIALGNQRRAVHSQSARLVLGVGGAVREHPHLRVKLIELRSQAGEIDFALAHALLRLEPALDFRFELIARDPLTEHAAAHSERMRADQAEQAAGIAIQAEARACAERDRLRAELEAARREADDAREERDHWHAKAAHIGQALGMAAPDSSDWRDVSADAVGRRAEAARAVSELVMLDLRDLVAEADRPRGGMGPQWQHELAGAARMPSVVRWARRAIARYDARASGEGT